MKRPFPFHRLRSPPQSVLKKCSKWAKLFNEGLLLQIGPNWFLTDSFLYYVANIIIDLYNIKMIKLEKCYSFVCVLKEDSLEFSGRTLTNQDTCVNVIWSLVTSRLDYCNSLFKYDITNKDLKNSLVNWSRMVSFISPLVGVKGATPPWEKLQIRTLKSIILSHFWQTFNLR